MLLVEQSELDASWSLIEDGTGLEHAARVLSAGTGPTGIDAERASGYRYGADAYLVQVHRRDAGTFLFDPVTIGNFAPLADAIEDTEWVLHAASQDIACLDEIGLRPPNVFDTELAARLLGYERVGLGSIVETLLGIHLQKAYSAADWSTRPLPEPWLEYAALDVVLLPDLHDAIERELELQEKQEIAAQEFDAILNRPPKPPAAEPWRKLSGGHKIRDPRQLAIARELWLARDELARSTDTAPGRLIPDSSIVVAATSSPRSRGDLARQSMFKGRASRSELDRWWEAVLRGKSTEDLPGPRPKGPDALPHHRNWAARFPAAAARLTNSRAALESESERQAIPLENLLTPEYLRRLAWEPPTDLTPAGVSERLAELGARPWQRALTAPLIAAAFVEDI
ncbi:MAG: HRDC domain-containing protein [Leucobacter sp.]